MLQNYVNYLSRQFRFGIERTAKNATELLWRSLRFSEAIKLLYLSSSMTFSHLQQKLISSFWPDMFHALGRFIFKRQFWQNMMIYYGTSSIAPDCPCYNVLCDGIFWWNHLNLMKIGKKTLGSWNQSSAVSAGYWAFFAKFWFVKRQNWIGRERGI